MARQKFDIGSKWLVHNHGKSTLCVAGLDDIERAEPMPGEIAQS